MLGYDGYPALRRSLRTAAEADARADRHPREAGRAGYFGYFAARVPDVRVLDHGGSLLADRLEQARAAVATAMLGIVSRPMSNTAVP